MTQDTRPIALRDELEAPAPISAARHARFGAIALLICGALFGLGYLPKQQRRKRLAEAHRQRALLVPHVALTRPKRLERAPALTLPGSVQGLEEAIVYARADGYVRELAVDMGDRVQAGQLLAALDNPEVEREIEQARANVASSEALLVRARAAEQQSQATLRRYEALVPGLTSREELDQKRTQGALAQADVGVAQAALAASHANLDRLQQIKAFSRVVAPFAGTVTARTVERGSLVSSGKQSPLFKITSLDTLRIFVQVPQSRVANIAPGQHAGISITEYGGQLFEGRVSRSAGALDSHSRTMTVEVRAPNPEHKLLPGMYASVTLELGRSAGALMLPATALILGEKGTRVATIDPNGRVRTLPVEIARDRGAEVEIESGLSGDESIIANPGPAIVDGSIVQADPS